VCVAGYLVKMIASMSLLSILPTMPKTPFFFNEYRYLNNTILVDHMTYKS